MNNVQLIGRLTKEPELLEGSNYKIATFVIAVARDKDTADFIYCNGFNKIADIIMSYFHKGSMIALTGRLRVDVYEKNGAKQSLTKVTVSTITFLNGSQTIQDGKNKVNKETFEKSYSSGAGFNNVEKFVKYDGLDDDLPF